MSGRRATAKRSNFWSYGARPDVLVTDYGVYALNGACKQPH
jgi:hypothetical protein